MSKRPKRQPIIDTVAEQLEKDRKAVRRELAVLGGRCATLGLSDTAHRLDTALKFFSVDLQEARTRDTRSVPL